VHGEVPLSQLGIGSVPLCIVDLETTGLSVGFDRVVEISVVRLASYGWSPAKTRGSCWIRWSILGGA
jgi:hypothetical protein